MGVLNYHRFSDDTFKVEIDSLFNPIIGVTRTDGVTVSFDGKGIKMDIMTKFGTTPILTLEDGNGLTATGSTIIISKVFTTLEYRYYVYEIYNDTDKISIMKGKIIVV